MGIRPARASATEGLGGGQGLPSCSTQLRNAASRRAIYQEALERRPAWWANSSTGRWRVAGSSRSGTNCRCVFDSCSRGQGRSVVERCRSTMRRSPCLILVPFLAEVVVVQMDVGVDGGLHIGMAEALLHVAGIPASTDQFGGMRVAQQVSVQWNAALLAVVAEHGFERMTGERRAVGRFPALVAGVLVEHDEDLIGLKGVVEYQVVEQGHDLRSEFDEALFAFDHALGQRSIRQASTPADHHAVAVKLQILDVQAQDFADAQAPIAHEQQDALELHIVRLVLKACKRLIANGPDASLRLSQCPSAPGHLPSTGMHQERLEAAEAVGDFFVQDGIGQHLSALHLVAVEAGDGGQDGVDTPLAEAARDVEWLHLQLAMRGAQPLDETQQVIGGDGAPVEPGLL